MLINNFYPKNERIREDGGTVHEMCEVSAARLSQPADSVEFYREQCTRKAIAMER